MLFYFKYHFSVSMHSKFLLWCIEMIYEQWFITNIFEHSIFEFMTKSRRPIFSSQEVRKNDYYNFNFCHNSEFVKGWWSLLLIFECTTLLPFWPMLNPKYSSYHERIIKTENSQWSAISFNLFISCSNKKILVGRYLLSWFV